MTPTRTTRIPVLAALAVLAACSGGGSTPEAACRSEAQNSPGFRDPMSRLSGNNMAQRAGLLEEAQAAERRSYAACMRARGSPASGGVETPRQPR